MFNFSLDKVNDLSLYPGYCVGCTISGNIVYLYTGGKIVQQNVYNYLKYIAFINTSIVQGDLILDNQKTITGTFTPGASSTTFTFTGGLDKTFVNDTTTSMWYDVTSGTISSVITSTDTLVFYTYNLVETLTADDLKRGNYIVSPVVTTSQVGYVLCPSAHIIMTNSDGGDDYETDISILQETQTLKLIVPHSYIGNLSIKIIPDIEITNGTNTFFTIQALFFYQCSNGVIGFRLF